MLRKIIFALIIFSLLAGSSYGSEDLNVIASIFPIYDWTREITKGTGANISLLLDKGIDLHSYNPSVNDMVRIAKSDIFIYVGGESDQWVNDALKNVVNDKQVVINLLEVLGSNVKLEEQIEGMQHEHDHDDHDRDEHDHDDRDDHDDYEAHDEHEAEADEHVWLSLRNAEIICRYVAEKFIGLDPANEKIYASNLLNYIDKLQALDDEYEAVVNYSARKILLFGDRFPFRYLADDYGLKYYAAFSGCSAETEASFETVKFLAEKVNELDLPCVLTIEGTRHKIAQTIIANTKAKSQKILVLNSMQSVMQKNSSYISIMRANPEVLKDALN